MFHINRRGFTLAELMIVIGVIGILAASLFPSLKGHLDRAAVATQLKSMLDMKAALDTYFNDKGKYPTIGYLSNPYGCLGAPAGIGINDWIPGLVAGGYISKLPDNQIGTHACSPSGTDMFAYVSAPPSFEYKLISHGRSAKYVITTRPELIDPRRDGGTDGNVFESGATLVPWSWGYWTSGAIGW